MKKLEEHQISINIIKYTPKYICNDEDYEESEFINGFNSNFNNWNRILDNQLANLKYYSYDKTNNITKTNINYEVGIIENNIDLSSIKKDEYQFYVAINFDENGNLTINDIKGANIQNFEYLFEQCFK